MAYKAIIAMNTVMMAVAIKMARFWLILSRVKSVGMDSSVTAINSPFADFDDCVQQMYEAGAVDAPAPGAVFHYSGSHLQIAGLMAVRAAGVADWPALFAAWQADTGLFPTAAYDLPSATNPRLAGGMHWTGEEYLGFLQALATLPIASSALFYSLVGSGWGQALSGLAAAAIVLSALLWPLPGATQIAPSRQA